MRRRFTWSETPRGTWICEHGAYAAVLELRTDAIGIRITCPDATIIAFDADEDIPAFAQIEAEQRMVAEATKRGELQLLRLAPRRR